jgi:DNA-binding IclR family transcriptional regulator
MRMEAAGLGAMSEYELPISQEQLADAVALTPVHVNRTLMTLEQEGLIKRRKRLIWITDWRKLSQSADFHPRYLHLNAQQTMPEMETHQLRLA